MTYTELFQAYPLLLVGLVVIVGLLVGSFLNVVIHRLPLMMEREWKSECRLILELDQTQAPKETFNLAYPNSHCPNCNATIGALENIPVLSYLVLGGKCKHCKEPISIRYPLVEAATGLISGLVAIKFGLQWELLAALVFSWALVALTMIDADTKLLPDQITLPLLWLGLVVNLLGGFTDLESAVLGAVFGYLTLWSVYWAFKIVTGKEGMGYGDFKLLAALGAWLGWQALPGIILLSSLVGAVLGVAILTLSKQDKQTALPFGPYLAVAGWIYLIYGAQLNQFYLHYSGLN
jgi:leader peptidase (prepilin peptidase)/N-methyltransferase